MDTNARLTNAVGQAARSPKRFIPQKRCASFKKSNMKRKLIYFIISVLFICGCEKNNKNPFNGHLFAFKSIDVSSYILTEFDTIMKTSRIVSGTISEITEYIDANEYIPEQEKFYSILNHDSKTYLSSFSVKNGELVSELPLKYNVPFLGLHFDRNKDLFYSLQMNESPILVSIDPYTAEILTISKSPLDFDFIPGDYHTTLCLSKNIYALIFSDFANKKTLCLIDIDSGDIVNKFVVDGDYKGLFHMKSSSIIYCLKQDDLLNYSFGYLDINNGKFTMIKENIIHGELGHIAFDSKDRLKKSSLLQQVIDLESNDTITHTFELNKYNLKEQVVESSFWDSLHLDRNNILKYDYRDERLLKTMEYNHQDSLLSITFFEYQLDKFGNWIEKKAIKNDILTTIIKREIEYK